MSTLEKEVIPTCQICGAQEVESVDDSTCLDCSIDDIRRFIRKGGFPGEDNQLQFAREHLSKCLALK